MTLGTEALITVKIPKNNLLGGLENGEGQERYPGQVTEQDESENSEVWSQETPESDDGGRGKEFLQRNATNRIKGRILIALSKNLALNVKTAYIRWWIRTHKKFAKKVLTSFAIKSQLSTQIAFWRFKWLAAPGKKKRRFYQQGMETIMDFVEVIETRQRARVIRNSFFRIRLQSECKKMVREFKASHALNDLLNIRTSSNYNSLKSDTGILGQSDIFQRMVTGVMGKYQKAMDLLRSHRLRCLMEQRLSNETLSKLCERLCKAAEGSLKGIKHAGYDRLVKNKLLFDRKKAVCKRVCDANFSLMSQGWNTLEQFFQRSLEETRQRMKFVIKQLTDQDTQFMILAYNGMKSRYLVSKGVGMSANEQLKTQLIKRLMDKGYNLQVMAANALREFLAIERRNEDSQRLEHERQQREKERILKRIMDSNTRMMGIGYRQSYQFMETERERERLLHQRQQGILRRIVDSNVRFMSQGFNKLIEEYKARQAHL
jgi:hypothetical protein